MVGIKKWVTVTVSIFKEWVMFEPENAYRQIFLNICSLDFLAILFYERHSKGSKRACFFILQDNTDYAQIISL